MEKFVQEAKKFIKIYWKKYLALVESNKRKQKVKRDKFISNKDTNQINGYDCGFGIVLLLFSAFSRIWVPQNPRYVAIPEQDSIVWINNYLSHNFCGLKFPPLGMMVESRIASKMEYISQLSNSTNIIEDTIYISLRTISEFFSMISVVTFYYILRYFNINRYFAFADGFLFLLDHTFIAPTRYITDLGFTLFFSSLSILILAVSQQFPQYSNSRLLCFIFEVITSSCAFSSSFTAFPILLFVITWPVVRYGKSALLQTIFGFIAAFIITDGIFITYSIYTPQMGKCNVLDYKMYESKLNNNEIAFTSKSISKGTFLFFKSLSIYFKRSFISDVDENFLRRFFLCQKYSLFYKSSSAVSYGIQNNFVLFPAIFFLIIENVYIYLYKKRDENSYIIKFSLFALFLYGFLFHPSNNMEAFIPALFVYLSLPIAIERRMNIKSAMFFIVTLTFLGGISYFGWGPEVYAYVNPPKPFIKPLFL